MSILSIDFSKKNSTKLPFTTNNKEATLTDIYKHVKSKKRPVVALDEFEQLATQRDKPTFEQVIAYAKKRNITDADTLWRLYDKILRIWADHKNYSETL